jgi:hypothetical protein
LKAKNDITSRKGCAIESYGGGNTKLHDLVYQIPYQFLIGNLQIYGKLKGALEKLEIKVMLASQE